MINTYQPQAGTLPARVIDWLKQQKPGESFASAALADAMGTVVEAIATSLMPAVRAGALKREQRGRLVYWSLGDGIALEEPEEEDVGGPQDRPFVHRVVPAAEAGGIAVDVPASPWPVHQKKEGAGVRASGISAGLSPWNSEEPLQLRFAVWSDGRVVLQRGADSFELDAAEVQRVRRALERMGEEVAA